MRKLADEHYPDADIVRVVLDNLSTHTPGALYDAFEPSESRSVTRHEIRTSRGRRRHELGTTLVVAPPPEPSSRHRPFGRNGASDGVPRGPHDDGQGSCLAAPTWPRRPPDRGLDGTRPQDRAALRRQDGGVAGVGAWLVGAAARRVRGGDGAAADGGASSWRPARQRRNGGAVDQGRGDREAVAQGRRAVPKDAKTVA